MAMTLAWVLMLAAAILAGALRGELAAVSLAAMEGAQKGVTLALSLAGGLCLWSGAAKVMERTGLSDALARAAQPLLCRLFPIACADPEARQALCGNLTANLLGLGNAATPLGVAAIKRMQVLSGGATATNEMCRLVVMNTASLQLLPTTVAALRASLGASRPFDLLPAVWLSSLFSVSMGLLAARLMEGAHD